MSISDETPVAEDNTTSRYTEGYNSVLVSNIMTPGNADNKQIALKALYETYSTEMEGWQLPNLKTN